jgi:hypothetical protein
MLTFGRKNTQRNKRDADSVVDGSVPGETRGPALQDPRPPHIPQRRQLHDAGPEQNRRSGAYHPQLHPRPRHRALQLLNPTLTHCLQTHLSPLLLLIFTALPLTLPLYPAHLASLPPMQHDAFSSNSLNVLGSGIGNRKKNKKKP